MTQRRDRCGMLARIAVRALGALLLAGGLGLAFLAPWEVYCFYLFSEGGPFHYAGFGVGSFMFANIAAQIVGYEALAAMLIPLGYAHLVGRRWGRHLAEALLTAWLVAGVPFVLAFLAVLLSSKDISPVAGVAACLLMALAYPTLLWLGHRFYRWAAIGRVFAADTGPSCWIERIPPLVLALGVLYALFLLVWHVLILLRGLFPVPGGWVTGMQGITLQAAAIVLLGALLWGTLRQSLWAWWGGLAYIVLLSLAWITSLATSSWAELLTVLELPESEIAMLQGLPLEGYHLAALLAVPVVLLLIQMVRARRAFGAPREPA